MGYKGLFNLKNQCHGCLSVEDGRSKCDSSHCIGLFWQEYFGFSTKTATIPIPGQNSCHFADYILQEIFLKKHVHILSLFHGFKFFSQGPIDDKLDLAPVTAWRQSAIKHFRNQWWPSDPVHWRLFVSLGSNVLHCCMSFSQTKYVTVLTLKHASAIQNSEMKNKLYHRSSWDDSWI